ncbi:homoserine kinase [Sphingorhabdus sp. YGSMI21]|uniref:homoserine kinase n=1 Tax=Sphingorhabdus sp. YGSMI21 TaxID=2077182 RepID=UPI000C1E1EF7|nr:homoserine kinase [Sphingorhabdus sp. YGSMI21]ATW04140.1 homoserine kinase [Sphingorhabdus sp. YGSMI21]
MAVYTKVSAEEIDRFLTRFDVGTLVSAKGIAEGVENSNYLLETTQDKFILTLYEKRVDPADLPFFIALLDHLAEAGCLVPPMIADRDGTKIQQLCGRSACLITFLPGVSVSHPTPDQARATGRALGDMHRALADFTPERRNSMDHEGWRALADQCGPAQLDDIALGLAEAIAQELDHLDKYWPDDLPRSAIHADLFPDNVLMLDDRVTGLIDFYFSCTDIRAYDLAVTHAAWCFSEDGTEFHAPISRALLEGYGSAFPLSEAERRALPLLARGAALRFLLTRAYDWINTPAGALVTRKDPQAFLNRLQYYRTHKDIFTA